MFDHSVGPSAAAPSVVLSRTAPTTGVSPGDVVVKGNVVRIAQCVSVSSTSNAIARVVVDTMMIGGCNVQEELVEVETNRLAPSGIGDANFVVGGLSESKITGEFPVSLGGTGKASFASDGLLVGTGGSTIEGTPTLSFDPDTNKLTLGSGAFRFEDGSGDHFDLHLATGAPRISSSAGTLQVANLAGPGGIAPSVQGLVVDNETDSNAELHYEVNDEDSDQRSLYIAWYDKATDYPRDAEEIIAGTDAISFKALDVASFSTGTTIMDSLSPISDYVVRCVADDSRGNVSLPRFLDFRTTEFGAPTIVLVTGLSVGTGGIAFSASNEPDTSDLVAYAGAFLSANALSASDLLDDLTTNGLDGIFTSGVPANTDSNVSVVLTHYRDATNASVPIEENKTYYPFYLIVDAEANASLCNLEPIFYGNAPVWDVFPQQKSGVFHESQISVEWSASDPSGIAHVYTYVGTQVVSFETLETDGEQHAESTVSGKALLNDNEAGQPIEHTSDYIVTVAAVDSSGLCNIASFDAKTLDNSNPSFTQFDVSSFGTNAMVQWVATDRSGIHEVYLAEKSEAWAPTPSDVKSEGVAQGAQASFSILSGTPSWCNTHIFGVAEDNATQYGAANNLLSPVQSHTIFAPAFGTDPAFAQASEPYKIDSVGFQVEVDDDVSSATVYFSLFSNTTSPEAHSNNVFNNLANSAKHDYP